MRVNRLLSELLLEDLARYSGMTFKHPDRLTRAEANAVLDWARTQAPVVAAYRNSGGTIEIGGKQVKPGRYHEAVKTFAEMVNYFAHEHPQSAAGEPEAWPAKPGTGRQPTPENPFANLDAEDAAAVLAWAQTSDEYLDAYLDKSHPQHADRVARTAHLMEVAYPSVDPSGAPAGDRDAPSPDTARKLEQLMADPAYRDRHHPDHKAAVDRVTRIYESEFPPGEGRSNAAPEIMRLEVRNGQVVPKLSAQERIDQGRKDPAYLDKNHPDHAAAVESVSAAYREAYPAPAAPSEGSGPTE
ncbi:MAG TPA: hypothetical protein VKZ79_07640 [Alphaproteobacteria bacterium]|nr:hypothetical protein [Alphaproteobacteria bacterium]